MIKMKAMVIGLGPEYNYPGSLAEWKINNTQFASNHGASLISRAIAKQFNAEHVDDFSNIADLQNRYDCCIVALASHISSRRDVSFYADVIEKLDIKTVAFSLGVQDYAPTADEVIAVHPSVKRLLDAVAARSNFIGVRGHHTAFVLHKLGFRNVVPIGCPTLYWNLSPNLIIKKGQDFKKPLVAFHRTLAGASTELLLDTNILGHDFLDEAIFTDNLVLDQELREMELKAYRSYPHGEEALSQISRRGIFPPDFDTWFSTIGQSDFVFGPRLHGCIGALVQGIPAVLLTRDLRTKEMAEMFRIPHLDYGSLKGMTAADLYEQADFEGFSSTYKRRYINYLKLTEINELESNLAPVENQPDFSFSLHDLQTSMNLVSD